MWKSSEMQSFRRGNSKIDNPLNSEERTLMKKLAKFAKGEDLLEGRDRKLLYQSGRYDSWFPSVLERLPDVLKELKEDIVDSAERDTITDLLSRLLKLNPDIMVLGKKHNEETITKQELLRLAELYEQQGDLKSASSIATEFNVAYPGNNTIRLLLERVNA